MSFNDQTPITQAQYEAIIDYNPSEYVGEDPFILVNVSWLQAVHFVFQSCSGREEVYLFGDERRITLQKMLLVSSSHPRRVAFCCNRWRSPSFCRE